MRPEKGFSSLAMKAQTTALLLTTSCLQCYMPHPSHYSLFDHTSSIWCEVQITKLLVLQYSQLSCYFLHLRRKFLPGPSVLENRQPMFLPRYERPSVKIVFYSIWYHHTYRWPSRVPVHRTATYRYDDTIGYIIQF